MYCAAYRGDTLLIVDKVKKVGWLRSMESLIKKMWPRDLKQGFDECMRVLKPTGTLVFKWNDAQLNVTQILSVVGYKPLFGQKRQKTHWLVFNKQGV